MKKQNELMDEGYCYSFKANGEWTFGDNCKSSNAPEKKVNVLRLQKKVNTFHLQAKGVAAKVHELIVLTQECPISALRGVLD